MANSKITDYDATAHQVLIDILSSKTGLPAALFSWRGGKDLQFSSEHARRNYADYCKAIRESETGLRKCADDQCQRIRGAREPELTLCHAGLYNYVVPIEIEGEVQEALVLGEMRLKGERYDKASVLNHKALLETLDIDETDERRMRGLFTETEFLPEEKLSEALEVAHLVAEWYSTMRTKEMELEVGVEKVTHELQIRLQAVFALAENFYFDLLDSRRVAKATVASAKQVLNSIMALNVVIQNFGEFMEHYRFERAPIAHLIYESRALYETEASNKGVSINVQLELINGRSPELEISEKHIQLALHNLVQNAVKYSFRGTYDRPRYIDITGRCWGDFYCIDIQNFGVGILPEEYDKIFKPGYQGKLTEREYRTGSGRGLYFVNKVIDAHRGKIKVVSTDQLSGWLTTFSVCLPFKRT